MSLSRLVLPVLPALMITVLPGAALADGPTDPSRAGAGDERTARSDLEPGRMQGASVVKSGWWYVANEPPPDTGVVAAPQPPAPTTPAGSMPVAAVLGEALKVSAVEFALEAEPGSSIDRFEMVLQESGAPAAALGGEVASVVACPVTELFWADGQGAAWKNRPTYDCDRAEAAGVRDDQGRWSFDLTAVASGWTDTDFVGSRGIVLVEKAEAPESFDVAFTGFQDDGVGLVVRTTAPEGTDGTDGAGTDGTDGTDGTEGGSTSGGTSGGALGGGSGGGGDGLDGLGGFDDTSTDGSALGAPAGSSPDAGAGGGGDGADGSIEAGAVPVAANIAWYSGLPRGVVVLLPFVLALAYLMMLALGPAGRPDPAANRRGVSRALDRLRDSRGLGALKVVR
ncbi:hypothetical protein I601_3914 [Nocardioides dokdonensis FR1436]|uniref:Uncharacterized protein n=1 Tax=Nocardioides dokdonensis FR1436 TaxID=1300347 RepID=A0A1A9GRR3_9ACTN|nr:hypothetical protein [Nocardioides dokdonensis]ANH40312.1 hypothetical protein I601_3914 [Nocardioides dokdonensis FR1436]